MATAQQAQGGGGAPVMWKHIGLHAHSVGTFVCEEKRVVWKSAITGGNDDGASPGTTRIIPASKLKNAYWTVFGKSGHLRLQTTGGTETSPLAHELRFDGFPEKDFDVLKDVLKRNYNLDLQTLNMSSAGTQYGLTAVGNKKLIFRHCVLDEMNEEGQAFEPRAENEMLSLDLAEVSQCVLPGNNRNEIEVQFPESDTLEQGTDQLVAIRFYVPPDIDADPADKAADTAAELLQQKIMQTASIRKTTGDVIVSFNQDKGTFLTPRGRYGIELYDWFMRMRGMKYDYKVKYEDINRLFLLPKPDELHMAFVIALDKPIRQGQQRYQCLVLQASKDPDEVTVNLDEETLKNEYGGELQPVMRGSLSNLVAKTFKIIAKKKVFIPGKFANANQQACVKCAVGANEGLLYPLEKQFVFIHKPPILIRFNEVDSVEFQRYAGGQGSTRNFDLCVNLKPSVTGGTDKAHTFSGIDRSDYAGLYNFLLGKKIPIKNLEGSGFMDDVTSKARAPVYNEDEIYGGPDENPLEEDSDDEDFDDAAAAAAEKEIADDSDEDLDDDELGSEIDEDLDSDLEEAGRGGGGGDDSDEGASPKKKSTKKKKKKADSDDDDSPAKKKQKKKDKNAPKRGRSAYMYFSNAVRQSIKAENPDVNFAEMGKLIGAKWKVLTAEEKVKYEKMASTDKERYQREMKDYSPPTDSKAKGKATKKGKKKDANEPKKNLSSFMFFSKEMRTKLKAEDPEMSFGDLGKKIGELFRALSPQEKQKYEKMAEKDKLRYKEAMATYTKSKAKDDDSDDDSEEEDAKPKPKAKAKKAESESESDSDSDSDEEED